jgi:hypothetical protein
MKRLRLLLICLSLAALQYCLTENSLPERVWGEVSPWFGEEPVCQQPDSGSASLPPGLAPLPAPTDTLPAQPGRDASAEWLPTALPKLRLADGFHFLAYFLAN